ncbi:H-NS family nucleoid-associated regulatory protein [Achromobacter pestifer]|uniref:H-NS family nucleoid-associated regulatory protein n=1 Tax=Achromobacter pestifer TaxID=1353889 RepID=UPI001584048E
MLPKHPRKKMSPAANAPIDTSTVRPPKHADWSALAKLVRYRDAETGNTWCGFGRPPNWIRGKDRERFRVR